MSSPISRLAQELIDEIVDNLAEIDRYDDWESIKACGLVCRAFVPRCETYLFAKIILGSDGKEFVNKRVQKLCELDEILKRKPYIADHVQELHFILPSSDNAWISRDSTLLGIMEILTHSSRPFPKVFIDGQSLEYKLSDSRGFAKRFIQPFVSPFVTSLRIERLLNVPIAVIENCINLKDLKLTFVDFQLPRFRFHNPSVGPRPRIQKLEYAECNDAIKLLIKKKKPRMLSALDLSDVRVLETSPESQEDMMVAADIIGMVSRSIQELYLFTERGIFVKDMSLTGLIDLRDAFCLRILDVDACFEGHEGQEGLLAPINSILATIPNPNQLQKLCLTIFTGRAGHIRPHVYLEADWKSFAMHLERISGGEPLLIILRIMYRPLSDVEWEPGYIDEAGLFHPTCLSESCQKEFERLVQEILDLFGRNSAITIDLETLLDWPGYR